MRAAIYLICFIALAAQGSQQVMEACSVQLFPEGNVPRTIVKSTEGAVSLYPQGEPQQIGVDYYAYERVNGVTSFAKIPAYNPNASDIAGARSYRDVMEIHFGAGAHTNTAITEAVVTGYFLQRRINGTSEPTDASDALLLQSFYQTMRRLTVDGTAWAFPWGVVP
jgi:hypothetical protein